MLLDTVSVCSSFYRPRLRPEEKRAQGAWLEFGHWHTMLNKL